MDPENYIPVDSAEGIMNDKEIEPNNPYITTTPSAPTTPRTSQTFPSTPPDYPIHQPPLTTTTFFSQNPPKIITPYTISQAKNLTLLTSIHTFFLLWWTLSIFIGIYSTPTKDDYDPNEHGITPAFASQLLRFRISLIGIVPAALISLFKLTVLPRLFNNQRVSEEYKRLTVDTNHNTEEDEIYGLNTQGYAEYLKYGKPHLLVGQWWEKYIEWERLMNLCLHVFGMVVTIWLAVGKFRGYIRPRGPFDDAICAFSDPRAYAGDEQQVNVVV
ncbi:hypothetical protein TWF102_011456 [Orbilia oligospora]|uniref:Uncharacterized protein n=1 Tax=Orbilia oligospora TaxID=2813651 RepID=A0A7C8NCJ9_ORBOL|nr:hypothetical protein TWF102_011456 [Orbilia oligospora]KAF3116561.1 hypothetical protein TWF103_008324 [Orbilia oligospora]